MRREELKNTSHLHPSELKSRIHYYYSFHLCMHAILFPQNTIVNSAPAHILRAQSPEKVIALTGRTGNFLKLRNLFFLASPFDIHLIVNTPRELRQGCRTRSSKRGQGGGGRGQIGWCQKNCADTGTLAFVSWF